MLEMLAFVKKDETRFKFKFNLDNTLYGVVATMNDGLSHLKCCNVFKYRCSSNDDRRSFTSEMLKCVQV